MTVFIEIGELPQALREFRKRAGLTLKQAAAKSGVSFSFISDIERGRTKPSFETLDLLMTTYGYGYSIALRPASGGATAYCRLVNTAETRTYET